MDAYEIRHRETIRAHGAECAVLLRSDGSFPLDAPCKLALYGSGARRTVQGGTGSGEVNSRGFVTAEDGLEAAGFTVTSKAWLDAYGQLWPEARKRFLRSLKRAAWKRGTLAVLSGMGAVMPEPDYALPLDADGEAAIYVLSRSSGEGSDRKPIPGDILLTKTEQRDILALDRKFKRFLLVLNVGGVVDLSPVFAVRNILLLSQLGTETGHILADIVRGKATPSGKLATTWTAWGDYSAVGTFGDRDDTRYKESVYVGYRYFDRVGKQPLFPFGFGLSFTDFSLEAGNISAAAGTLTVETSVRNTGHRPGKEVVQLYVSPPQGKLDKPYQSLAAFGKTETLQPGAKQSLALTFDLRDLASYDASRASWVLEPGDYVLRLGRSSADTRPIALLRLDGEAVLRKCRNCLGMPDFTDWKPDLKQVEAPAGLPVLPLSASAFRTEAVDYTRPQEIDPLTERLSDEELCLLNIGSFRRKGARRVVGDSSTSVAGAAGETCSALTGKGIPSIVMADGPAGLRLSRRYTKDETGAHALDGGMPESMRELMPAPVAFVMKQMGRNKKVKGEVLEQNCTAIPIATALAQSWNLDFARQCGELVGEEMARFGVQLWLAPALNLHRDIRCGRNFEYYSEDPLLSGKFAAAVTRGIQRHPGCGATVKHFAANNQETRRYSSNSQVSERALRELYLRSFEIAVRESRPCALMTSYNLINGTHSSERRDLIEDVLRAEFGFQGIVMSDWITAVVNGKGNKYPAPNAARIAAAGGDLIMPGCMGDLKALRKGLKDGLVTRRQLQINATRVIRMAQRLTETRPG